ncbi:sialidase family protein [Emticicia sp. SJ17W-69]|uniref:sialidase family protein n=1 Tax=Emticicia sp. SJ17W-69 TaxID=3421657 RepID=UPI003EB73F89
MKIKLTILTLFINIAAFSQAKLIREEYINPNPEEKSCHASTIVELTKSSLMAAWFAGEHENHYKVCIWASTFSNGNWSKATKIADGIVNGTQYACWNPVLFKSKEGKLFLFYKVGVNPREWWGMMKTSTNDGKTWSEPIRLPDNILGPIKNKPIQLASGEILHPSSTESLDSKIWKAHVEISDANAQNWKKIDIENGEYGVIQPSLLTYPDGKIQMLLRSRQNNIIQSWSSDNGKSWGKLSPINLQNPNSGIDAVTLMNGSHVLIYNPLPSGNKWSNGRNILKVAISKDGINWTDIYELENKDKSEYSYPAVIQTQDGLIHITYTYDRKLVKYVVLQVPTEK